MTKVAESNSNNCSANMKKMDNFLYILIFFGLIMRFFYPFFSNPYDHLYSDPYRHYDAIQGENFGHTLFSILDPPLPQLLLKAAFTIFGNTILGGAAYYGLLCAIMPWCWYRWGRLIFPSKTTALLFMAIITYLPSWIGIYSLFMDEPVLLPLLGTALWLSWRAKNKATAGALILATIFWALTMCVKLNSVFELIIVMPWLIYFYIQKNGRGIKTICTSLAAVCILAIAYLSYPAWVYHGLGFTWLFPPGTGALNRGWYNSDGVSYTTQIFYKGKLVETIGTFGSNGTCSEPFAPFSKWSTWRSGVYNYQIICNQPISLTLPYQKLPWQNNLRNATEETLHLFFSQSWPDCRDDDPFQLAQSYMRWLWAFLTLGIIILTIRKRQQKNILVILCLGTLLLYIISNCSMIDGRYRKPWEGIAIAAFIYLCAMPRIKKLEIE
jgi:hypothetical protein